MATGAQGKTKATKRRKRARSISPGTALAKLRAAKWTAEQRSAHAAKMARASWKARRRRVRQAKLAAARKVAAA